MTIFIGADHRGFELKSKLIPWLESKGHAVTDCGNTMHDPADDYPDYAFAVAEALNNGSQDDIGIVICGSGIGVSVGANRFRGVRCALALNVEQVKHGRENDNVNCLALASDYISFEKAQLLVDTFLITQALTNERFIRRQKKLDK